MNATSWITGLMRENYDAVGFIPEPTVQTQYIANGRYILQCDERGMPVGYLLHGQLAAGEILVVSQHCIELDKRMRGYGEAAFRELVERARLANCRSIKLRCAQDLPSNNFWRSVGMSVASVKHPQNTRNRAINVYVLDLWPTLWPWDMEERKR